MQRAHPPEVIQELAKGRAKEFATEVAGDPQFWVTTLELAVGEVFERMLGSRLETPGRGLPPHARKQAAAERKLDTTAVVGLAGPLCGMLSVRCSRRSAARMAARMLGMDGAVSGPDLWDAIGEICNMVAGHFKSKIPNLGEACMLSVPTVITGADYALHTSVHQHIRTVLLFEREPVVFLLEVHHDCAMRKPHR